MNRKDQMPEAIRFFLRQGNSLPVAVRKAEEEKRIVESLSRLNVILINEDNPLCPLMKENGQ